MYGYGHVRDNETNYLRRKPMIGVKSPLRLKLTANWCKILDLCTSGPPPPPPCKRTAALRISTVMPLVRLADAPDLPSLLALFAASEVSLAAEPRERAERVWQETLAQPGVHVFVSDERDRIAATCMLITAP